MNHLSTGVSRHFSTIVIRLDPKEGQAMSLKPTLKSLSSIEAVRKEPQEDQLYTL